MLEKGVGGVRGVHDQDDAYGRLEWATQGRRVRVRRKPRVRTSRPAIKIFSPCVSVRQRTENFHPLDAKTSATRTPFPSTKSQKRSRTDVRNTETTNKAFRSPSSLFYHHLVPVSSDEFTSRSAVSPCAFHPFVSNVCCFTPPLHLNHVHSAASHRS